VIVPFENVSTSDLTGWNNILASLYLNFNNSAHAYIEPEPEPEPEPDTTAPVINLTGDNPYIITEGTTYTDPGATADTGETVTNNSDSVVNTSVPEDYTVTYTATDAAGNTGTATRIVRVEAAAAPAEAVSLRYTVYNSSNPIAQPADRYPGLDLGNTNVVHIEAKLNNQETGIINAICGWDVNFNGPVSKADWLLPPEYGNMNHNFNIYTIQVSGGFGSSAVPKYNNMTEGNADGTIRGTTTPYFSMSNGTNKVFAATASGVSLADNVVIPAPADPSQWFTLFYARADDSGETLPIPTTSEILVSPRDGNYGASDVTTVSITNIPSA